MNKLILASVSGIALMGLAACSDTDGTTTQAVPDQTQPMEEPATPNAVPPSQPTTPPAEPATPPTTPPAE
jgi:type IV pilus biogenesis protein CpaD/CtpE